MSPKCNQKEFDFGRYFRRQITARFDGSSISGSACSLGWPAVLRIIALEYEDLNDHDELRGNPLLALLAGKQDLHDQDRKRRRNRGQALAASCTLHRLERTTDGVDRHKKIVCDLERVDELLVNLYLEASSEPLEQIVLDLDVTDTPLLGGSLVLQTWIYQPQKRQEVAGAGNGALLNGHEGGNPGHGQANVL